MKNTKKGFTLVELLVVIAILAILASVAVVGYTAFLDKAKDSKAETELHQIVTYINAELMDDGKWEFVEYGDDDAVSTDDKTHSVTKENAATTLAAAIAACPDLGQTVTVTVADGVVTLTYAPAAGGKATATLR